MPQPRYYEANLIVYLSAAGVATRQYACYDIKRDGPALNNMSSALKVACAPPAELRHHRHCPAGHPHALFFFFLFVLFAQRAEVETTSRGEERLRGPRHFMQQKNRALSSIDCTCLASLSMTSPQVSSRPGSVCTWQVGLIAAKTRVQCLESRGLLPIRRSGVRTTLAPLPASCVCFQFPFSFQHTR